MSKKRRFNLQEDEGVYELMKARAVREGVSIAQIYRWASAHYLAEVPPVSPRRQPRRQ